MIIDKASREFLDRLISSTPDFADGIYSCEYLDDLFDMDDAAATRIIDSLESDGLVKCVYWSGGSDLGISLTQKGYAYKEIKKLEALERWKERLLGFLFGIVATLLTWFITTHLLF